MWGFHDGMGWWMVVGGLWMLAFWAGLIWLVVRASSQTGGQGNLRSSTDDPAIEIAKKRLARGEISREEFEELAELLRSAR